MAIKKNQNQFTGKTKDIVGKMPEGSTILDLDTGMFYYSKSGITTPVSDKESVKSVINSEPVGSRKILNAVSLTQEEYDAGVSAGTIVSTTFYLIIEA